MTHTPEAWTQEGEYARCVTCGHAKGRHMGPGDCRLMRDDATVCPCPVFTPERVVYVNDPGDFGGQGGPDYVPLD